MLFSTEVKLTQTPTTPHLQLKKNIFRLSFCSCTRCCPGNGNIDPFRRPNYSISLFLFYVALFTPLSLVFMVLSHPHPKENMALLRNTTHFNDKHTDNDSFHMLSFFSFFSLSKYDAEWWVGENFSLFPLCWGRKAFTNKTQPEKWSGRRLDGWWYFYYFHASTRFRFWGEFGWWLKNIVFLPENDDVLRLFYGM